MNFWDDLYATGKPVLGLSPMDGVTDAAMRYMTAKYGRPSSNPKSKILNPKIGVDLLFTEFVSVDALKHAKEEKSVDRVMRAFIKASDVGPLENKPYEIAQVFGHTPELFYQAAVMIATLGFDGMDINMGCPAHKVEEQGSGAGLIRFPVVAQEIVRQSKQAMVDFAEGKVTIYDLDISPMTRDWVKSHSGGKVSKGTLPVSVKTRIGVDKIVVEEWMETLMEVKPANISLHGRTLKQLYQGSADWEAIGRAAKIVHKHGGHILGNGDVISLQDGMDKVKQYGVDGFLIGRAAEGNPAIFLQGSVPCNVCGEQGTEPCMHKRLSWMVEHAQIYERVFGRDNFMPMRKHLAWYCKGFEGAVEMRTKLMQTNSADEVQEIVGRFE